MGINPKISLWSGERASKRVRKRYSSGGENPRETGKGKERESELFRESIWRLANSYAGIMFSELFVGPQCVRACVAVEVDSGTSITETPSSPHRP